MNKPDKNHPELPDRKRKYKIINSRSVIPDIAEERFEHWCYLMYHTAISQLICSILIQKKNISAN